MSTFVVERKFKGQPIIETISGVEDIDMSLFPDMITTWVCETPEEITAVESELRRKHARSSQSA
jgi:hypothetical protein